MAVTTMRAPSLHRALRGTARVTATLTTLAACAGPASPDVRATDATSPLDVARTEGGTDAAPLDVVAPDAPIASSDDAGPTPDASPDADAGRPYRAPWDWVGVIGTGQSLSIGAVGNPPVSTTQPFHNLRMVDTGPAPRYPLDGGGMLAMAPLVEPIRSGVTGYPDNQYPANIAGETPHTAMANQLTALAMSAGLADYVSVHAAVGWSGHCLRDIDLRGPSTTGMPTRAYPGTLSETRSILRLATAAGRTFGIGAVVLTHGECDAGNAGYADGIVQLITDYDRDLRAVTGQSAHIVLLASQQSTIASNPASNAPLRNSQLGVWHAGVDHPDQVVCVGPKYQYQYAGDNLHLPAAGYRRLGEKYAEVFDAIVNRGIAWRPLEPTGASRAGTTITVNFHVPNGPLAWEDSLAMPHQTAHTEWARGRGFEVMDSTGALTITAADIRGDSVVLTLAAPPRGTGLVVRYAVTQDGTGIRGGLADGMHGQLRDSDPLVGHDAEMVMCTVTRGMTAVTCAGTNPLARRTGHDLVDVPGMAATAVIQSTDGMTHATLAQPWPGASGAMALRFRHDLRNYCVHFELAVP